MTNAGALTASPLCRRVDAADFDRDEDMRFYDALPLAVREALDAHPVRLAASSALFRLIQLDRAIPGFSYSADHRLQAVDALLEEMASIEAVQP